MLIRFWLRKVISIFSAHYSLFQSSEKAYRSQNLQIFSPIIRLLAVHPEARGRGDRTRIIKGWRTIMQKS